MKINDQQNEERILAKTSELLSRHGIRGWNMDELAAEAGLAKNTLYRIIVSKEKLIEQVVMGYSLRALSRVNEIIDRENNYLEALAAVAAEFSEDRNILYADFLEDVFLEYPGIEKTIQSHRDEMTARITDFIWRGVTMGYLKKDVHPEFVFEIVMAISLFFIKSGFKGKDLSDRIHEGLLCLLYGIVQQQGVSD